MPGKIFISYGHVDILDVDWLERLRPYLMQSRHKNGVEVWDDRQIEAGSNWRDTIRAALRSADAAILLIGPGFLGSDFIRNEEAPLIFESARESGLLIFPLIVRHCAYENSDFDSLQAFNDPKVPLESIPIPEQNGIMNDLAKAINKRIENRVIATQTGLKDSDRYNAIKAIRKHLADTLTAFSAQARRRNDLVRAIEKRTRTRNVLEYEKFFFKHFGQLTTDERFEFDQIRAVTEGPLAKGNRAIVDILEKHPELLEAIPTLIDLRQHLVFWLNKYDLVFSKRPEMCLLYAGVEDAVPFPSGVDDKLEAWLGKNKQAS